MYRIRGLLECSVIRSFSNRLFGNIATSRRSKITYIKRLFKCRFCNALEISLMPILVVLEPIKSRNSSGKAVSIRQRAKKRARRDSEAGR